MTTANEITDGAYRVCGVHSPVTQQDTDALSALNGMVALWSTASLVRPYWVSESFSLVAGTGSYTIGSGGDFSTARPMVIEDAYIRSSDSVDHPVETRMTQQEYNDITNKTAQVRPERLFYDPQNPLGIIYFDTLPAAVETLHLFSSKQLTTFALLTTELDLPPEYVEAMKYNLAVRLAPEVNATLEQITINIASSSLSAIQELNAGPVPWANFDRAITYRVMR